MQESFLWFDLETFGRDPKRSRIAQFAAIRTDSDLRVIGDPVVRYCQPARDLLPSPEATLITASRRRWPWQRDYANATSALN
jgi:exodeoxyribonuclease-1